MHSRRADDRPPDSAARADPLTLAPARVHEAGGRGRRAFALFQAARHPGPLFWIAPAHEPVAPAPPGLPDGVAERLHRVVTGCETDLLWSAEEALRAGPAGLVIAEPGAPLSLKAGRRLQLAAEAGRTTGLMLIREDGGGPAAETRWRCEPTAGAAWDSTPHRWSLTKNKKGTLADWTVFWDGASAAFDLVSEAGERREPAPPPGGGALRADAEGAGRGASALPEPRR